MTDNKGEINEKIIQALVEIKNERIDKIEKEMDNLENAETLFQIDPKTEKKILKLIKNYNKTYYKYINTASKKVSIFIVVLVLTFSTSLITVESFRTEFTEFIVQTYEKFSLIFLADSDDENAPAIIEEYYAPTWIPDGFEVEFEEKSIFDNIIYFSNQESTIYYSQTIQDSTGYMFDTENVIVENLSINGCEAIYIVNENSDSKTIIFSNDMYIFSVCANVSKDDLVRIASSIQV